MATLSCRPACAPPYSESHARTSVEFARLTETKMAKSIVVTIVGLVIILTSIKLWSSPSYYAQVWAEQAHRRFGPKTPERAKTAARCVLAGAMLAGAVVIYGGLSQLAH
jgi:hypothetical protein